MFSLFFLMTALGNLDQQGYGLKTAEVLLYMTSVFISHLIYLVLIMKYQPDIVPDWKT